jgi:uncharacterized protein YbjT (DUF2867 family)
VGWGAIALVAGGAGTIESAVVRRLRAEGAYVVAASRHIEKGVVLDVRDEASVNRCVELQ